MVQTILTDVINNKVIVDYEFETTFINETFVICRRITNNYIEVTMTIRDVNYAEFGKAYYLEFFEYASKYNGWFVCSKVERYAPGKKNAVFMRIIPLISGD